MPRTWDEWLFYIFLIAVGGAGWFAFLTLFVPR